MDWIQKLARLLDPIMVIKQLNAKYSLLGNDRLMMGMWMFRPAIILSNDVFDMRADEFDV